MQNAVEALSAVHMMAAVPTRISQLALVVNLRIKFRYALGTEGQFTIHSIGGFRLRDGTFQLETIAGYCHARNALRTYRVEQIESVRDPANAELVTDLPRWAALRQPPADAPDWRAETTSPAGAARTASSPGSARRLNRMIEQAINCAAERNLSDVVERLKKIQDALAGELSASPRH